MRSAWSKLKRISVCGCELAVPSALPAAKPNVAWRQIANPRRLTILFWLYIAQALAGTVVGFTAPFLYYFGVL